jgi:Flp pilus assembly protein TadG
MNLPRFIYRFFSDRKAQVAVQMAIMAAPLLALNGAAVDFAHGLMRRAELQNAVDAAALATARIGPQEQTRAQTEGTALLHASLGGRVTLSGAPRFTWTGDAVTVEAAGSVESLFGDLVGDGSLTVAADATATASSARPTEIVFAIDVTNSMAAGNNDVAALNAIRDTLEQLDNGQTSGLRASVVPFTDRVNIGTHRSAWLRVAAPSGWNGCVEPREETQAGWRHWLRDTRLTSTATRFFPTAPGHVISSLNAPGLPACSNSAILGPFETPSALRTALGNGLNRTGTGRMDEGMAWAWRLLSTEWQGLWGVANYPRPASEVRKIAIMITDGHTTAYEFEVLNDLPADKGYGWNNGAPNGFGNLVRVCDQMKDDDIEIFAIFLRGNAHVAPFMQQCASGPDYYFDVDTLGEFLKAIGSVSTVGIDDQLRLIE